MRIIDISNRYSPVEVAKRHLSGPGKFNVQVIENHAFVAAELAGLMIVDITNKSGPVLVGSFDTVDSARDVVVSGSYAYVADNGGQLQILKYQMIPTAIIDDVWPAPAYFCQTVDFAGYGTVRSGSIEGYQWRSDIDGNLSSNSSFSSSELSVGNHTIYLKVVDDGGLWSIEASTSRLILSNALPNGTIEIIDPPTAKLGKRVIFGGNGTDSDGEIIAYQWISDIDGEIGNSEHFYTAYLSEGTHTISFRVQDDRRAWSEPVTAKVEITSGPKNNVETNWMRIGMIVGTLILLVGGCSAAVVLLRQRRILGLGSASTSSPSSQSHPGTTPGEVVAGRTKPPPNPLTIECPNCQARMDIPQLGRVQDIICDNCGIEGKLKA